MYLKTLGDTWNHLGETDPMWAVLTDPARRGNRWDKHEFFETGRAGTAFAMHAVSDLRFPLRTGKALDFGCAVGRLTQALACYFDEVHGVDIAPAMVRQARAYNPYGQRCRFHVNQRADLKMFADGQFDFIFSLFVLQHMRPSVARGYLAEFLRVLAPGGLLLFQQPTHFSRQPIDEQPSGPRTHWHAAWPERLLLRAYDRLCPPLSPVPRPGSFDFSTITTPRHPYLPPLDGEDPTTRIDAAQPSAPAGRGRLAKSTTTPPPMRLHTMRRWKVLAHMRRLGGRVLAIQSRNECSPHHPSLRYFVTR